MAPALRRGQRENCQRVSHFVIVGTRVGINLTITIRIGASGIERYIKAVKILVIPDVRIGGLATHRGRKNGRQREGRAQYRAPTGGGVDTCRSEERRVGKECR